MTVDEYIQALENRDEIVNADDVAEFLYAMDAKEADLFCPVARGLHLCGAISVSQSYTNAMWTFGDLPFGSIKTHTWRNRAVRQFIRLFDHGWYPELLSPVRDRPSNWRRESAKSVLASA